MKVFMRELSTGEFEQVFENNWNEEDIYIDDSLHHSKCWGDCYAENDLEHLVKERRNQQAKK